jgi:hypothetical protein
MTRPVETVLAWLVATVFAVAAGFVAWFLGATYSSHYAARGWVEVPAAVQSFDLRTSRSRGTGSSMPTIQSRLTAVYTYEFEGLTYTGDRVDFSFGSDNFSGARRSEQLARLRSGPVTVFVDPSDPRRSVFDRRLPGGQIVFALIFLLFPCGVGTVFVIGTLTALPARLGLADLDRFMLPFIGIFHGAPALYPLLFDPASFGPFGWLVLLVFTALLAVSMRSLWRRIKDPSIGQPRWADRLKGLKQSAG